MDQLEMEQLSWVLYDHESLGHFSTTDQTIIEPVLYTNGSEHLMDTLGTGYMP